MAQRRLSAEERAAWRQLAQSVRSYRVLPEPEAVVAPVTLSAAGAKKPVVPKLSLTRAPDLHVLPTPARRPAPVLDGSWEKQISRGRLVPEMAIDLHGHTLSMAHARLDLALAQARAQGVRVLLVVTGKARNRAENATGKVRGAIRAEIGHWIDHSPHADTIASVRNAHPRHGGDGAIYVILRRNK